MFEFTVGGNSYVIAKDGSEIRVYAHIFGEQKEIIIQKIRDIIAVDEAGFRAANTRSVDSMDRMLDYVHNYAPGNKTDGETTRTLGRALYNYLEYQAVSTILPVICQLKTLLEKITSIPDNRVCALCLHAYQSMNSVRFDPEKREKMDKRIKELLKKLTQAYNNHADQSTIDSIIQEIMEL